MNTDISESNSTKEKQKTVVTDNYNYRIAEAEKAYDDSYRENAIQKLINERQVAESMANMGLTDSGLNRTQQTAVLGRKAIMSFWKTLKGYRYTYCNINGNYPNMGSAVHIDVK